MLFKSHYDAAPEAVDEAVGSPIGEPTAEGPPALSQARQRLALLLGQRTEAESEMSAIQGSLRKLASMANAVPPLQARLDLVRAGDAEIYRRWSELDSDAPAPAPNEEGESLVRQIAAAKLSADTAATAVPLKNREFVAASNRHAELTNHVNAVIAEIIREAISPRLEEIVSLKADLAVKLARAQIGIDLALSTAEKIPAHVRTTIASAFYQNTAFEELRVLAASPSAPSAERYAGYHDMASRLSVDPAATIGGEG